jgi:HEAT repeat protein
MHWWVTQRLRSKNPTSRRDALLAIGSGGDPRNIQLLAASLSDRDAGVRLTAVRSLALTKEEAALPPLLAALKDPEPAVRELCALSFRSFADPRTIPYLRPLLEDPDAAVRAACARSLQQTGWQAASDAEQARFLVALGEHEQAATLGPPAFEALVDALRDRSHSTRRFALEALARLEDNRIGQILLESLTDPDIQVRVAAAEELANYQGDEYVVALSQALNDPEPLLRAAAAAALSRMGNATCVPFLLAILQDGHWSVRKAAADALGQMGCPEALEALAARLSDPDHDVREAVVVAMGRIGDQRAIAPLVRALADPTSSVRQMAAAVLAALDPEWHGSAAAREAVPALEELTQARDYWVRYAATTVLTRLKGQDHPAGHQPLHSPTESPSKRLQVLSILLRALDDFDRDIRLAAAEALGRLEDTSCASPLRLLLKDPDEWVQLAATKALQQVTRYGTPPRTGELKLGVS